MIEVINCTRYLTEDLQEMVADMYANAPPGPKSIAFLEPTVQEREYSYRRAYSGGESPIALQARRNWYKLRQFRWLRGAQVRVATKTVYLVSPLELLDPIEAMAVKELPLAMRRQMLLELGQAVQQPILSGVMGHLPQLRLRFEPDLSEGATKLREQFEVLDARFCAKSEADRAEGRARRMDRKVEDVKESARWAHAESYRKAELLAKAEAAVQKLKGKK